MFGPNKVSQSLIDAVTKVMEDKGVAETQQLDEASEKVPTPTGMKVYGSSYGNSAKARRDQTKSHVDTIKGPKEKDLKEDGDCVTKPEAKDIAKKEVHHHNKTMHKGQKDTTKNEEVEEDKGVMSFKDRLLERAMTDAESKKKEKIVMSMKDKQSYFKKKYGKRWKEVMYATATKQAMKEEMVDEASKAEIAAAHDAFVTQTMNLMRKQKAKMDKIDGRKTINTAGPSGTPEQQAKRHGKMARDIYNKSKNVKEEVEVEELDETRSDNKYKTKALAAKLGRKFRYDNGKIRQQGLGTSVDKHIGRMVMKGEPQDAIKKYATSEEVEVEENFADEHGIGRDIADKKQKMATASNTGKGKPLHNVAKGLKAFLQGKKEPMESVNVEGEVLDEKASVDMLRGRVHTDKPEHNAHKSSKVDLADREELPKGKIQEPHSTKARSSIEAHDGLPAKVDNLDPKLGTPNSFSVHTEAKDPETSDAFGAQANFVTNGQTSSDEPKKKELSEVSVDEKVIAGTPGWVKSPGKDGVVTDKSGAKHTPMSRARDLARQAFKKVQKETLGSAPNNQTGV